jgi:hypothetical protein
MWWAAVLNHWMDRMETYKNKTESCNDEVNIAQQLRA